MTKSKEIDDNERESYLDKHVELEQVWKEVDELKSKIGKLDIEVANLKDENGKLEQQKQNLINNFQTLYGNHTKLEDQVVNSLTAINITVGKLAEAVVRNKFIIPEADNTQQE